MYQLCGMRVVLVMYAFHHESTFGLKKPRGTAYRVCHANSFSMANVFINDATADSDAMAD